MGELIILAVFGIIVYSFISIVVNIKSGTNNSIKKEDKLSAQDTINVLTNEHDLLRELTGKCEMYRFQALGFKRCLVHYIESSEFGNKIDPEWNKNGLERMKRLVKEFEEFEKNNSL